MTPRPPAAQDERDQRPRAIEQRPAGRVDRAAIPPPPPPERRPARASAPNDLLARALRATVARRRPAASRPAHPAVAIGEPTPIRARGPIIQRRVTIQPDAYATGIGLADATQLSLPQLLEYFQMAVRDEVKNLKATAGEDSTAYGRVKPLLTQLNAVATPLPQRIVAIQTLVTELNTWFLAGTVEQRPDPQTFMPIDTVVPHPPNVETRYAQNPASTWSHSSSSYAHTASGVSWSDDPDMRKQFAAGFGPLVAAGSITQVDPRGKLVDANTTARLPLNQLTWTQAKTLLPRPLLNLIFDLRYQLEPLGGGVIDERTADEQRRKVTTPNQPGTLRSWHSDSPKLLPDNAFDATTIPQNSSALHTHYTTTSASGAGASQKGVVAGPAGYAEYTGTGSNTEHNTKVVLDYIGKRVYLTLTHYQYWALITTATPTYEFYDCGGTQDIAQAQSQLDKRLKNTTDTGQLMSPWLEIVMP